MTREEAIKEIEKVFEPAFANYIITALTEGATVSEEQEPKLDKIRAEIENIDTSYYSSVNGVDMTECAEDIKHEILQIIDKYKSKDKELDDVTYQYNTNYLEALYTVMNKHLGGARTEIETKNDLESEEELEQE